MFSMHSEGYLRTSDGSVSFLASRIPDLSLDSFTVYLYTPEKQLQFLKIESLVFTSSSYTPITDSFVTNKYFAN